MKKTGKRGWPQEQGRKSAQLKSTFLHRSGLNFKDLTEISFLDYFLFSRKYESLRGKCSVFLRKILNCEAMETYGGHLHSRNSGERRSNTGNISRIILIFYLGLFSAGCLPPPFPTPSQIAQQSQNDGQGRAPRPSVKNKSCYESKECQDLCEIVFNRRTERDDCEDRTVSEVREFKRIHYFLQGKNAEGNSAFASDDTDDIKNEKYFGNLNRIVAEDLEDMVSISENPETLVDDIPSGRKATFRNWIANNQDIAEIFRDEDEDFAVFKEIFGDTCLLVNNALKTNGYIEKPDGISHPPGGIAIRAGNRDFLQWVYDYLSTTISGATPPDPKTLINHNGPPNNDNWCNPTY